MQPVFGQKFALLSIFPQAALKHLPRRLSILPGSENFERLSFTGFQGILLPENERTKSFSVTLD